MPNITIFEDGELIVMDEALFTAQREQLAGMDLMLLSNQAIDIALLEDQSEIEARVLAFNLTFARLKKNLVAGAVAVAKLG
jgi:hypothetical protein